MEQPVRSPIIEHFIPAPETDTPDLDDDTVVAAVEVVAAELDGAPAEEEPLAEDVVAEEGSEAMMEAAALPVEEVFPLDEVTSEEEPVEVVPLSVSEDGGRVWLHVPSEASAEVVIASLPAVVLPGGVLWLSLGGRVTTASEVARLCEAASEALDRPVAGVRAYRGGLADGVRQLAGVAVEFDGDVPGAAPAESRGRQVLVVERTLRSGSSTKFRGDVLVYGDVNAGAEIEAAGNIVVLGSLRGLAWAGCGGDESAMVISFDLRPTQVRIGRRIAFLPERPRGRAPRLPEVAVVRDEEIVLREYRGRLG